MLRGCDPKKLLWTVTASVDQARRFADAGFGGRDIRLYWPALPHFKRSFLDNAPEAVEERLHSLDIDAFHGTARFVARSAVSVDGSRLEGRFVAIATGSKPAALAVSGAEYPLTSEDFLELRQLPGSIIFIGGDYISFESAPIAARTGAAVTILHEDQRPLAQFDRDLVERILDKSRRIGSDVRLDSRVDRIERHSGGVRVYAKGRGANDPVEAGAVVHGAGRVPDIDDLDLDAAGIERDGHRLRLTPYLQSVSNPAAYAAGDAAAAGPRATASAMRFPIAPYPFTAMRTFVFGCMSASRHETTEHRTDNRRDTAPGSHRLAGSVRATSACSDNSSVSSYLQRTGYTLDSRRSDRSRSISLTTTALLCCSSRAPKTRVTGPSRASRSSSSSLSGWCASSAA